ncbi:hypothetical protein [Ruminococcus sp.]|uniref:hypothetical protein n=1 Tax=Ruminococcus sp. TaxID=41978 RepID=UPI003A909056
MGSAHKIFRYNNLLGTNIVAVCVLAHSLKNRRQPFRKEFAYLLFNEWLFVAIAFKGIRCCVQAAKQLAVWLSKPCVSLKYCGLCPHPQPLKKVDQIFIFGYKVCANLSKSFPTFAKP